MFLFSSPCTEPPKQVKFLVSRMAWHAHELSAPLMTSVLGSNPADRLLRFIPGSSVQMLRYFSKDDSNGTDAPRLLEAVLPPGRNDSPHPSLFGEDNLHHTGDLFEEVEPGLYAFRGRSGDWLKTLGGLCDTK